MGLKNKSPKDEYVKAKVKKSILEKKKENLGYSVLSDLRERKIDKKLAECEAIIDYHEKTMGAPRHSHTSSVVNNNNKIYLGKNQFIADKSPKNKK